MAIVFVLSVAVVAVSRPKGCGKLTLPANTMVIWSAPFLSGGGYCSEVCNENMEHVSVVIQVLRDIRVGNDYLARFA